MTSTPTSETFETPAVTVIGGGTMGQGIAASALVHTPALVTVVEAATERHAALRERVIAESADHGAADAESRLTVVDTVVEAPLADLIVEAVPEIVSVKVPVLRAAEQRLRPGGILTSNTSSLSITELADALEHPDRFLGMHFFQPVLQTGLTELVLHPGVSEEALAAARNWTERLRRESISAQDSPGFATSRLGVAIALEAMRMVEEGVATPADIDRGMELGYQHGVGPLRMTDMVGLDVRLAICEYLERTLGPRFTPPRILREMVAEGRLGRKTGQGFFVWDEAR